VCRKSDAIYGAESCFLNKILRSNCQIVGCIQKIDENVWVVGAANDKDKSLDKYGLQRYFREIISGNDDFPKKPDPSSFDYLIAKYHLVKHETLGVGDRDLDVKAAVNAGITSCYFNLDGVEMDIATYNIRSINDLLLLLE